MKALFISTNYPSLLCGVGDYTYCLTNQLTSCGYDVSVLTSRSEKIVSDSRVKVLSAVERWDLSSLPRIIKEIHKDNPDFICLQYSPYAFDKFGIPIWLLLFAFWTLMNKIKLITTFHEVAIEITLCPRNIIVGIVQRLIARMLAFMSYKVVVTADYRKAMFSPCTKNVVSIPIGSGILSALITDEEKSNLKALLGVKDHIILSTFGTLAEYRRHDLILQAMKNLLLKHNFNNFHIVFIGASSDNGDHASKALHNKIHNLNLLPFVSFTGYLKPADVFKYLSITDIFFMLNTDSVPGMTTKSSAVAAAYFAGLPVLSTHGPDDAFFENGENIFYAKSQTVADIEEALWVLIQDKDLRHKISKGANDAFKNELAWDVLASKYNEVMSV